MYALLNCFSLLSFKFNNESTFQSLVVNLLHQLLSRPTLEKCEEFKDILHNFYLLPASECFEVGDGEPDNQQDGKKDDRGDKDQDGNRETEKQNK